ncbi:hypothetical protein [Thermanaeromonas toyohensis]|uniref:hypothetical protein n=1 Tax=Thermanaeromonas toyohensis TaxID=161154 RepID=UPI0012F52257|nr:hypothetical protein [Thermanaeromonas toyohensis]
MERPADVLMQWLKATKVVDFSDFRDIACGGDRVRAWRETSKLIEAGIVRAAGHPGDGRKRCLVLTAKGARELGVEVSAHRVIRSSQLGWFILRSRLYVRLLKAGFAPEAILGRKEALEKYRLDPQETYLAWVIADPGPYCLYVPWPTGYGSKVYRSVNNTEGRGIWFEGHVLVHDTLESWRYDRRRFLRNCPPGRFLLLRYDQLGELKVAPGERTRDVGILFEAIAPGGRLTRAPIGTPLPLVYTRRGSMLVGDMRLDDISLAARVIALTGEMVGGWNGVTLVMRDEAHAADWARFFGNRRWLWYLTASTLGLYQYDGKRLLYVGGAKRRESATR